MKVTLLHLQELSKPSLHSTKKGGLFLPRRATTTNTHRIREALHFLEVPRCPLLLFPSCFLNQSSKFGALFIIIQRQLIMMHVPKNHIYSLIFVFLRTGGVSNTLIHSYLVSRLNCLFPLSYAHDFHHSISF
jgi:hypothetical protein